MENLRLNENQTPDIDREWLLIESQNRELNRLFSSMESDKISIFDAENVLLNIWNSNPNARPYILSYIDSNSQNITSLLSEANSNNSETNEVNTDKFKSILNEIDSEFSKVNQMFNKNDKEWFWEIDDWEKQIISKFESNTHELLTSFDTLLESENLPENIKNQLTSLINKKKQEYLKITVWIWDKFEWSAWALKTTEWLNNALSVLPGMISSMSPNEILNYIKNIHETIDSNNRQSDSVINNYSIFTEKLSNLAYENFKKLDWNNKKSSLLELAKVITWRWSDIDDRYRDPELAENILADLMNDKWWVFEKILDAEKIDIVDDKLDWTAQEISNEFKNINIWDQNFLDLIWFSDIKEITEDYSNLSPEQKIKISTLSRIKEQIKTNPELDIISALQETATKTASELYDPLNDLLGHDWHDIIWKNSWDYWLNWLDWDIFNLYQDIAWAWLFDLSDKTVWNLKEAWKMWAMIAIAIWAWIWAWLASPLIVSWVVASAIVTWVAVWVTSVVASQAIYQNWYDTKWEATKDIWSDLIIASATWAIWWWVTAKYMTYWTKSFFSMWALKNAWLAFWDWALWMWSEYARQQLILWKEASFADMMKLWWPMLAFWMLMWAKTPHSRAELEIQTRNLDNWLDFANDRISLFESELQRSDLSVESKDLLVKQKAEYENLRAELNGKKYDIQIEWGYISNEKLMTVIENNFEWYEDFQDVLKKFVLDDKHPMNIVSYLRNPETVDITIKELREILDLWTDYVSQKEMANIINSMFEWESILLKSNNLKRDLELKKQLLESNNELFEIWLDLSYSQHKLLKNHAENLSSNILPELKNKLNFIISDIDNSNWFPAINARAKSADWIIDKIWRMRNWNDWKKPRIDYNLSDMPDAVWWRITVTDISQLEQVMSKVENTFWKENIFEIDNFYSSAKKENPYRVITYTVLVDWIPCELQLTTLKSSLVADIWHNTWYKKIHELPEEVINKLANLQRQTTLYEHSLLQ